MDFIQSMYYQIAVIVFLVLVFALAVWRAVRLRRALEGALHALPGFAGAAVLADARAALACDPDGGRIAVAVRVAWQVHARAVPGMLLEQIDVDVVPRPRPGALARALGARPSLQAQEVALRVRLRDRALPEVRIRLYTHDSDASERDAHSREAQALADARRWEALVRAAAAGNSVFGRARLADRATGGRAP